MLLFDLSSIETFGFPIFHRLRQNAKKIERHIIRVPCPLLEKEPRM
jgi:hypothetical protein